MTAVIRLILTYFSGTALARWITATGLMLTVAGTACLLYLPPLRGGIGMPSSFSLGEESALLLLSIFGALGVFFGGSLMSLVFAQQAGGRLMYVLPFGRLKLLVSAFITVALVTVVSAGVMVAQYIGYPVERSVVFSRTATVMFLTYSLMYVILWLVRRSRTTVGVLGGAMLVIAALSVPLRFISVPSDSLRSPLIWTLVLWGTFVSGFLLLPQLKNLASAARLHMVGRFAYSRSLESYKAGSEVELIIGVAKPWMLALGQVFPILVAMYFIDRPKIWLFYFTLFSVLAGAVSSFAAARSRSLWLRAAWNRAELFSQVEAVIWRHSSYTLGTLLLLFVAIGIRESFEPTLLALGLILLVLGSCASTYLGLMMTRGIGGLESCLAIVIMLLLMGIAIYVAGKPDMVSAMAFEFIVAVLAVGLRGAARRRWIGIDWTMCRPERNLDGRHTR